MEFSTTTAHAEAVKADAVAVGVFADGELTASARALDKASRGAVKAAIKSGDSASGRRRSRLPARSRQCARSSRLSRAWP